MALSLALRTTIEAWIEDDCDAEAAAELRALYADSGAAAEAELVDRFTGTLEFGTAGLRGVIAAGPNRFNRAVCARATVGLLAYLAQHVPHARERGVVIGYDGRRLSLQSAQDTAELVSGAGFRAYVFPDVAPTPLTAFATLDRDAAAGIMITASHNPPEYNGYKVYWGNGAQIIPPHDGGIADAIARVGALREQPRLSRVDAQARGLLATLEDDVVQRYLAGVRALLPHPELPRDITIAYTALHGVGDVLARRALAACGFTRVHSVASQAAPDGRFPTVAFPNPEEKGAMDRVLALAAQESADLVLANDPDADRLAVAIRDRDGQYVRLTGNETGALIGHYLLSEGAQSEDTRRGERVVMCSIVSSPMLADVARAHGAHHEFTLTGFKWLANRAIELQRERGARFVFAFEEAIGFSAGTLVRDKDGVSTAALVADLAAYCLAHGRSVLDELELAYRRYGLWLSHQVSVTKKGADGAAHIQRLMDGVRASLPTCFGAASVLAVQDLERRQRTSAQGGVEPIALPQSNVLLFELTGGHRIMMRPSGTEPKIKYYFDVRETIAQGEPIAQARARGQRTIDALVQHFLAVVDAIA